MMPSQDAIGLLATLALLGGALAAGLCAVARRPGFADSLVATGAVAGLLVLLVRLAPPDEAWLVWLREWLEGPEGIAQTIAWAPLLGLPLAGVTILALFSLAACRALARGEPDAKAARIGGSDASVAAISLAAAGTVGALLASDLTLAYALGTLSLVAGWSAALLDPSAPVAGARGAARYALTAVVGDLGVLAAALLLSAQRADLAVVGLTVAGAARLLPFPLHLLAFEITRLPGRVRIGLWLNGALLGVDYLGRAYLAGPPHAAAAGWLVAFGAATAAVTLLLPRVRGHRPVHDLSVLVDSAHVLVAFGVGAPLALAAGLLYMLNLVLSRATLLVIADATSPSGQQRRRLPEGVGLIPYALAFGATSGMPPQPGFVARWLIYLALLRTTLWPIALLLALAAAVALAALLRGGAELDPPGDVHPRPRGLAFGLALLWVPLGLFIVAPVVALGTLITPVVDAMRPGVAWSLGVDVLLGLHGVLALLLAVAVVVAGFLGYLGREPALLRWVRATQLGAALLALRRPLAAVVGSTRGLASAATLAEVAGQGLLELLRPFEQRFVMAGIAALAAALLLVALD